MEQPEALIVGAGPTGLTAAIELKRFGIPFRLVDKAAHGAEWSQALVVQARTLEQWDRYGIAQSAVDQGRKLGHVSLISEGKTIVSFALDKVRSRFPFILFFPQNDTERLLTAHLQSLGGSIERNVELTSLKSETDSSQATLRHSDGSTEEQSVRWVIGCDGAHSKVRESLNVPFSGSAVGLHFYLGDLQLEGPDELENELRVYLHRGNVVFIGRLSDKLNRVIVALHGEQNKDEKNLSLSDFQEPMDEAGIKLKAVSANWMTPFNVNDRRAEHTRIHSVFLAGDASHIHSPVGGQGMNTGIQDIANLAWKIAAVRAGADSKLLDSYEEERGPVGQRLLSNTARVLKAATSANPIVETLRDAVASIASRIPQVQNSIMGFISETDISYRHSSAVVDCGGSGSLHAGDRLPNMPLSPAQDGFSDVVAPLSAGRHLVIAIDIADNALVNSRLPRAKVLAINSSQLEADSKSKVTDLFGRHPSIFVVRPDGYIGFRGSPQDVEELEAYSRKVALV